MIEALVVGYGSDLRGDDGAGRVVAEMVEAAGHPGVRVLSLHQLTPEVAAELAECAMAVFVDADAGAGQVGVRRLGEGRPDHRTSHHSSPESLLALSREVYGRSPEAHLVTVPAASFELGSDLSATSRSALPAAARAIESLLA